MEDRKIKIVFIIVTVVLATAFMMSQYWQAPSDTNRTPASQSTSAPELE